MRIEMWDNYGESSLTIVSTLLGLRKLRPTIPQDPSDFERCIHLFRCLGYNKYEINDLLEKVAKQYPMWIVIADNWDKLMELYLEEKSQASAPKLYLLLKKLKQKAREK